MTHAAQFVLSHGALVLFTWILIQQIGLPIPSAPLLISIGTLASSGRVDLEFSLAAAFASLLADGFWYRLGRLSCSGSDYLPPRGGNWRRRALALVNRHSGGALVASKFVGGSNLAALLAGRGCLSAPQFLLYDSIACFTWSGGYMALGYLLRGQVQLPGAHALRVLWALLAATALWSAARLLRHRFKPVLRGATLTLATVLSSVMPAASQYTGVGNSGTSSVMSQGYAEGNVVGGSVPSGPPYRPSGGSHSLSECVGTSAVTTLIARRSQYHQSALAEYSRSPRFNTALAALATRLTHVGLSVHYARQQALARMYAMLTGRGQTISYVEVYWLLAIVSVLLFFLSFLLAKNRPGGQVAMH